MRFTCGKALLWIGLFWVTHLAAAPHVALTQDKLFIDGKPAPYLFGAEVQYFRARAGAGRNVPVAQVEALWDKLIGRVLEAHMNTVTLYIPWDFHEPVEGTFDFDGTLDQDGDGNPDYPSRNLRGFLKRLEAKGIRHIMVRPGPYINAEWGPVGFGAIPRWFLEKYPDSLTGTLTPGKPKTASFGNPVYREKARLWIEALHRQVLKDFIGPGRAVQFLQIDNETNYFWDSVYERDYSPTGLVRYRAFLQKEYRTVQALNTAYGAHFTDFSAVTPPTSPKDLSFGNTRWHYDWYHFHDVELRDYYRFIRHAWEKVGVREPNVLFTSCDSINAPDFGLLPRLDYRQKGKLSLTTMNIYPKTFGTQSESTLNTPMKAAHDAVLVGAAHGEFYGKAAQWVMSTETVGGWFAPTEVSLATRQHTYGALIGSGVKAMVIYYFHEGWNWDGLEKTDSPLFFDAPLDKDLNPRPAFTLLKSLGESLEKNLGAAALEVAPVASPVLLAHDSGAQYPVPGGPDAISIGSTDSAALFGLLREAGAWPQIGYLENMSLGDLKRFKLVVWNHPGYLRDGQQKKFQQYLDWGGAILWIGPKPPADLGTHGAGKFWYEPINPASGWNDDRYLALASAPATIRRAQGWLDQSGAKRPVEVVAKDGIPFVHAWTSQSKKGKRKLLFIENFWKTDRRLELALPVKKNATLTLVPLWGTREGTADMPAGRGSVGVEADSVGIWEIVSRP